MNADTVIASQGKPDFTDNDMLITSLFEGIQTSRPINTGLIDFAAKYNPAIYRALSDALTDGSYTDSIWYSLTGFTLFALYDMYTENGEVQIMDANDNTATLAFTGDVCLADDWYNMSYFHRYGDGTVESCFNTALLERMRSQDILIINNEFCFSSRGTVIPGKQYTFRANPENVSMLTDMGVDAVSLANNHCFDYGADAFTDTIKTLTDAGITYVGAGENLDEAMRPRYFIAGGVKIAVVAATRAEKYILTPEATESSGGVLRTYEPGRFIEVIQEAHANADYVIAFVHWGAENSTVLEDAQTEQGRAYIDAGADVVVGAHTHCLQGVGYYNGKPIVYSLGNFWFNLETIDTALLEITIRENGEPELSLISCIQQSGMTSELSGSAAGKAILKYIGSLSDEAVIGTDGSITEMK